MQILSKQESARNRWNQISMIPNYVDENSSRSVQPATFKASPTRTSRAHRRYVSIKFQSAQYTYFTYLIDSVAL